jgi:hypothetical protein
MALYLAVMSTTLVVSTLGLATLAVVRIERRQVSVTADRMVARTNARSAIELALRVIANDSSWRSNYANGVATAQQAVGGSGRGTISWMLQDSDGNLQNQDVALRLKGIGRAGSAVQAISVQLVASQVGPTELRSYNSILSLSTDQLVSNKWWGQYLKVSLPPGANAWRVTNVQVVMARLNSGRSFRGRLYRPLGNGSASSTVIDSTDMNSSDLSSSMSWQTIPFTGSTWIDPDEAICLTLETTSGSAPLELSYRTSGVSESNSALLRGDPTWFAWEPSRALRYRVNGYYSTSTGVSPISGSWRWDVP